MNNHLRKAQVFHWSALVHSTVHGRINASHPGSASISLWVDRRIQKAVLMQEPFYTYLLLILIPIHIQYVNVC